MEEKKIKSYAWLDANLGNFQVKETQKPFNLGNLPGKENLYAAFVKEILGGESGKRPKLVDAKDVEKSVYVTLMYKDKLTPREIYKKTPFSPNVRDDKGHTDVGYSLSSLELTKAFLTEVMFNADSTDKLLPRMFESKEVEGRYGYKSQTISVSSKVHPRLADKKSIEDCILETAEFCMTEFGGNVVIMPPENKDFNPKALKRYKQLCSRLQKDYDNIEGTTIFVRKQPTDDHNSSQAVQMSLEQNYKMIVGNFVKHPENMVGENMYLSRQQFESRVGKFVKALDLIEKRMTEETKAKIVSQREVFDDLVANVDLAYNSYCMGEEALKISKAAEKINAKIMSQKDIETIKNFQNNLKALEEILNSNESVADKRFAFFTLTKMEPFAFKTTCEKLSGDSGDFGRQLSEKIIKTLVKEKVFETKSFNTQKYKPFSSDNGLDEFNMRKMDASGEVIYDYSGENFSEFVDKVKSYAKENDLPHSATCYDAIAHAFIKEMDEPSDKDEKTK